MKIKAFSQNGESQSPYDLKVADKFLNFNLKLISQVLYIEENNSSRKTGFAKTKGEVRGGGRKPWKQKGTGRARAGSRRSPIFKGGGVTFGPRAISKRLSINKKMRDLAFGQLLVQKAKDDQILKIESFKSDNNKTKDCAKLLENMKIDGRLMVVYSGENATIINSWRNLPLVACREITNISLKDLKSSYKLIFDDSGIEKISKRLQND